MSKPVTARTAGYKMCVCVSLVVTLMAFGRSASAGKWPGAAGGEASGPQPELLLTFDDGPHENYTESILDTLDDHHLQGLFFWTGHRVTNERNGLPKRLALVERAVRTGHLIGNHTSTHAKLCTITARQAEQEIDDNRQLYETLSGLPMILFRVPYGARCKRLDGMLAERHTKHMHWDLDPQEFRHQSSDLAFQYVTRRLSRLANGKRAILLMHDTQPVTAKVLPKILDWIEEENQRRSQAIEDALDPTHRKSRRGNRELKQPIRIITASEFVEERYPVPLLSFARHSLREAAQAVRAATVQVIPSS